MQIIPNGITVRLALFNALLIDKHNKQTKTLLIRKQYKDTNQLNYTQIEAQIDIPKKPIEFT